MKPPSYASAIRDELGELPIKSLCCRRAYLYGLLSSAEVEGDTVTAVFAVTPGATYDPAAHAVSLIHTLFSRDAETTPLTRGAHRYTRVSFSSKNAAKHISAMINLPAEEAAAETLSLLLEWKCEHCAAHFLRGLFVASGTVNDPAKSFHMELKLPSDGRWEPVYILLAESGFEAGVTRRGDKVGLIFKSAELIEEVLAHIGATTTVFDFLNAQVEREIRNNENRATNCDAENISRSMRAGGKQTAVIRHMDELGLLPSLPDDLRTTARLRLENPEATLPELAALHEPAITKSGVHHRLERILAFFEKSQKPFSGTNDPNS